MIELLKDHGVFKKGDRIFLFDECSRTGDWYAGMTKQHAKWIPSHKAKKWMMS